MGKGKWRRWGRGSAEGYGLEIGSAFRGNVSKGKDGLWHSTMNASGAQAHATKEEAQKRIEDEIHYGMHDVLEDWKTWNEPPKKRRK